jgi:hypothetical protein
MYFIIQWEDLKPLNHTVGMTILGHSIEHFLCQILLSSMTIIISVQGAIMDHISCIGILFLELVNILTSYTWMKNRQHLDLILPLRKLNEVTNHYWTNRNDYYWYADDMIILFNFKNFFLVLFFVFLIL